MVRAFVTAAKSGLEIEGPSHRTANDQKTGGSNRRHNQQNFQVDLSKYF